MQIVKRSGRHRPETLGDAAVLMTTYGGKPPHQHRGRHVVDSTTGPHQRVTPRRTGGAR